VFLSGGNQAFADGSSVSGRLNLTGAAATFGNATANGLVSYTAGSLTVGAGKTLTLNGGFNWATGNAINGETVFGVIGDGTNDTQHNFPGYCNQWDQMLYRDVRVANGGSLTVGFLWQAAAAHPTAYRLLSAVLAVICVALPLLMLNLPRYQGLVQRLMYLLVFAWLWVYYPRTADA
jgi:hypothetical protein